MHARLFPDLPDTDRFRSEGQKRANPQHYKPLPLPAHARRDDPYVHTPQLTVEVPFAWAEAQEWRFRATKAERVQWLALLGKMELSGAAVRRFARCGDGAWVQFSAARGTHRVISRTCHSRACPECRKAAAKALHARLNWALPAATGKNLRLVTLTLKHTTRPLRDQLDFLRESFRRLRQRKFWRRTQRYGFAVIEISRNHDTHTWHPHLHVITHGRWMEQGVLKSEWRAVTHGSYIVDVRPLRSREKALSYILKYLTKGPGDAILNRPQLMLEWWAAVRGGRLFLKFGDTLKALPAKVDDGFPNDWVWDEPLTELLRRAARGTPGAQTKLDTLYEWACEDDNPYDHYFDGGPP